MSGNLRHKADLDPQSLQGRDEGVPGGVRRNVRQIEPFERGRPIASPKVLVEQGAAAPDPPLRPFLQPARSRKDAM